MKESEIEKSKYFYGKNLSIGLSKYPRIRALSGPNFELKIQLLFAVFGEKKNQLDILKENFMLDILKKKKC